LKTLADGKTACATRQFHIRTGGAEIALPSPEQLRALIEADRAALESSGMPAPAALEDDS
jgi:hypothetical protein